MLKAAHPGEDAEISLPVKKVIAIRLDTVVHTRNNRLPSHFKAFESAEELYVGHLVEYDNMPSCSVRSEGLS